MRSLVARLPADLERLELRFRWCSVGVDGASILAERLPGTWAPAGHRSCYILLHGFFKFFKQKGMNLAFFGRVKAALLI